MASVALCEDWHPALPERSSAVLPPPQRSSCTPRAAWSIQRTNTLALFYSSFNTYAVPSRAMRVLMFSRCVCVCVSPSSVSWSVGGAVRIPQSALQPAAALPQSTGATGALTAWVRVSLSLTLTLPVTGLFSSYIF